MKTILSIFALTFTVLSCNQKNTKDKGQLTIGQNKEIMQTPLEQSITRGKEVYNDFCKQCHRPKGNGIGRSYPPLAGSNWLTEKRTESIHAVKYGLKGEIEVNGEKFNNIMAPMGLSNKEVADVMNYTMNTWGNTQDKIVTEEEVAAVEK
ncbi:MAG: c-type cytochrome [Patiriisocius sp.]|uniref:c-type cytochrome n=1 Tax=Patiriisocius sp. TaxID=2822396 RepID=UPI003EF5E5BE